MRHSLLIALAGGMLLSAAAPAQTVLFDRLGGRAGLSAVANELIDRTASDAQTKRSFQDVKLGPLKERLAEQLCLLTGGGCAYTGDEMPKVHRGLDITEAEFYRMVEILREILDARGVSQADKNAVLAALAPMKRDVVEAYLTR